MEDIFSSLVVPIVFGVIIGVLSNYAVDTATSIPRSWIPSCSNCGKQMSWSQFFSGSNCFTEGCRSRRRPRFTTLILLSVFFSTTAWNSIDFVFLNKIHFILLVEYFLVILLIDMTYRRIPVWLSIVGIPLALITGISFDLTIGEIALGGAIGMSLMWIWHTLLTRRYKAQSKKDVNTTKPPLETVILATVIGIMVGFPKIVFTFLLFFYMTGILGIIVLLLRLIKTSLRHQKPLPSGIVLVLGAALTMLIIK